MQQFLNTLPVRSFGGIVHDGLFLQFPQAQDFFRQIIVVRAAFVLSISSCCN